MYGFTVMYKKISLSVDIPLFVRKDLTLQQKVLFDITPDVAIFSIYVLVLLLLSFTHFFHCFLYFSQLKLFGFLLNLFPNALFSISLFSNVC